MPGVVEQVDLGGVVLVVEGGLGGVGRGLVVAAHRQGGVTALGI